MSTKKRKRDLTVQELYDGLPQDLKLFLINPDLHFYLFENKFEKVIQEMTWKEEIWQQNISFQRSFGSFCDPVFFNEKKLLQMRCHLMKDKEMHNLLAMREYLRKEGCFKDQEEELLFFSR